MKNIKDEYSKYINIFIGIHIVLIYFLIFGFNIDELKKLYKDELYKGIILSVLPIIGIVLNGFLPNSIKEFLVFWKFKNRLPGNEAFSKYALKDQRVDINILKSKYEVIKSNNFDENKLWYKIYKKYEKCPSVWESQKNYLFTRDMIGITVLFFIITALVDVLIKNANFDIIYFFLIFIFEYLILKISSKNYAIKFVTNVLAEDSAKTQERKL